MSHNEQLTTILSIQDTHNRHNYQISVPLNATLDQMLETVALHVKASKDDIVLYSSGKLLFGGSATVESSQLARVSVIHLVYKPKKEVPVPVTVEDKKTENS